eukprot:m.38627 g.38627  ORF g.38627 m.38627 type:complete len:712 (+) comp5518_c0_seq1:3-2138(+)
MFARSIVRRVHGRGGVLQLSEEVAAAVAEGRPTVALESTIISHGMPYPRNIETAVAVEDIIRAHGAVPATIAILDGKIRVGLSPAELEVLASSKNVSKTSRRDLATVLALGRRGATTVSGTMIAAHRAGIPIFVTGGLGGVHRGAEHTMDISADLTELGRTPVAVVCAGVKSILDIGLTLEVLETQGVTVVTVGATDDFPAFFTPKSGHKSMAAMPDVADCARAILANAQLGLGSGMVFAVPVPAAAACDAGEIEAQIQQALKEAEAKGILGKDVTPYLLSRVAELSGGRSLATNIELVRHNAAVGAQIAVAHARLKAASTKEPSSRVFPAAVPTSTTAAGPDVTTGRSTTAPTSSTASPTRSQRLLPITSDGRRPVVAGGVVVDITSRVSKDITLHTTNYGSVRQTLGGVGRNVAEALHRLGAQPVLRACVGADVAGSTVLGAMGTIGMETAGVQQLDRRRTASYSAVLDASGNLHFAVGDMDIFDSMGEAYVASFEQGLANASFVVVDGNVPLTSLAAISSASAKRGLPVWFEPTSVSKALKGLHPTVLPYLSYLAPNLYEMRAIAAALKIDRAPSSDDLDSSQVVAEARELLEKCQKALGGLGHEPVFVVKMGPHGVLAPTSLDTPQVVAHYPSKGPRQPEPVIVSVTGAGDSLCGGVVAGLHLGYSFRDAMRAGLVAAQHSLRDANPVGTSLTQAAIDRSGLSPLFD